MKHGYHSVYKIGVRQRPLARAYTALGDKDRALTLLETAYDERDNWLTITNVDPSFDALRDEPRFRAILAKIRSQK